jgi:hypothetical protein
VTKKEPASAKKETPAQEAVVTPVAVPVVAAPVVVAPTVAATTVAAAPAPVALNDVASVVAETVALPASSNSEPAPALIAAEPPARLEVEAEDSPEREREVFAAVEESAAY